MIWNTIHGLAANIDDKNVRQALQTGLAEGLKAMQRHAGSDVEIRAGDT
jgi:hypothetical protein